ncbi:unnamed protein product, partial [Pylaiella littoralis]
MRHGILMDSKESNTHFIRRLSSLYDTQAQILLANPFATRANIESVVVINMGPWRWTRGGRERWESSSPLLPQDAGSGAAEGTTAVATEDTSWGHRMEGRINNRRTGRRSSNSSNSSCGTNRKTTNGAQTLAHSAHTIRFMDTATRSVIETCGERATNSSKMVLDNSVSRVGARRGKEYSSNSTTTGEEVNKPLEGMVQVVVVRGGQTPKLCLRIRPLMGNTTTTNTRRACTAHKAMNPLFTGQIHDSGAYRVVGLDTSTNFAPREPKYTRRIPPEFDSPPATALPGSIPTA